MKDLAKRDNSPLKFVAMSIRKQTTLTSPVGSTHIEAGGATSGVAPKKRKELATGSGAKNNGHCGQRPSETCD